MKIDKKVNRNELTIKLDGRLDTTTVTDLEKEIVDIENFDNIVFDFENLEYISSAGLRIILKVKKQNDTTKVINCSYEVYDIFNMTGFSEIMEVSKALRKISVDGCEIIGKGFFGTVYRIDPETIVKVYEEGYSIESIKREIALARRAFILGVPTAIPYDIVKVGNSYGSVFELINSKSIQEMIIKGADIEELVKSEDGSPEMFRQMIFEENVFKGYEKKTVIFKHKSRIYPKELNVTIDRNSNKKQKVRTDQKQMVYYSQKYADKQKRDRNLMIERANDLIKHPQKYNRVTASGSAAYINNIKFDKKTGLVADGLNLSLNQDKIDEEEKYDGYYSIVTSEINMTDKELRNKYRGLSKIEETFKITKSELEARPVLVWTKEHIESHFLTCFVALVITRLLENKLKNKYSINKIIESLKNYNSIPIEHNLCIQNYTDEIIEDLSKIFNIDFSRKYLTFTEIKKIFKFLRKN